MLLTKLWKVFLPLFLSSISIYWVHHERGLDTHGRPIATVHPINRIQNVILLESTKISVIVMVIDKI